MKLPGLVIVLGDLPDRVRELNEDELMNVYGGCKKINRPCVRNKDCCSDRCSPPLGIPGYPTVGNCMFVTDFQPSIQPSVIG